MKDLIQINKMISKEKVSFTKSELIISNDVSFDEWADILGSLKMVKGAVHFWIGDALNFGERKFGEQYSQALDGLDYEYQTLQNDKWISNKVKGSRRRETLTFSHHQEVADLAPEDQDKMLDYAEENSLNVKSFRNFVRAYKMQLDLPELTDEDLNRSTPQDFKKAQGYVMMLIEVAEEMEAFDINKMHPDARDFLVSQIKKTIGKLGKLIS